LWDYAFFVSFFPQLLAGPIVRAKDFIPQIYRPTFVSNAMFGRGIFLIMSGLFKKAIISDYISINFVDRIFDNPTLYTGLENLFAIYGYAIQIYCDFSGYSDMAIGIALLIGFQFPTNFLSPYQSASITEFWRRWHISLSTWLKDYLYISLGGNRKGKLRTYINLFITMLLGGLWHGASARFILWGGMHGLALIVEKMAKEYFPKIAHIRSPFLHIFKVVLTFHFVCFCWIFFRADNLGIVSEMLTQITQHFHPEIIGLFIDGYTLVLWLICMGYLLHFIPQYVSDYVAERIIQSPLPVKISLITLVIFGVVQIQSAEIQAFIYFQF
jgi:alginate O-acetyltransferase complex protein AlgI